jgi:hypothetical protein
MKKSQKNMLGLTQQNDFGPAVLQRMQSQVKKAQQWLTPLLIG